MTQLRTAAIEERVVNLCSRLESGSAIEYDLLEFKSTWPLDHAKAARRLAAHANAARGENIMWVIGPDEKAGRVTTAPASELATWWPKVQACFENGHSPALIRDVDVTFERGDGSREHVCALVFDTEPAPYVVTLGKAPAEGMPDREVPWREGRRTRTARRADLVRLLAPLSRRITLDLLNGDLVHYVKNGRWILALGIYIMPPAVGRRVFPYHLAKLSLQLPDRDVALELHELAGLSRDAAVRAGGAELIIDGPGFAALQARADTEKDLVGAGVTLAFVCNFETAARESYTLTRALVPARRGAKDEYHWVIEGNTKLPPVGELVSGFE